MQTRLALPAGTALPIRVRRDRQSPRRVTSRRSDRKPRVTPRVTDCEATFTLRNGVVTELVYNTARGNGVRRYSVCGRIVESCLAAAAPAPQ